MKNGDISSEEIPGLAVDAIPFVAESVDIPVLEKVKRWIKRKPVDSLCVNPVGVMISLQIQRAFPIFFIVYNDFKNVENLLLDYGFWEGSVIQYKNPTEFTKELIKRRVGWIITNRAEIDDRVSASILKSRFSGPHDVVDRCVKWGIISSWSRLLPQFRNVAPDYFGDT